MMGSEVRVLSAAPLITHFFSYFNELQAVNEFQTTPQSTLAKLPLRCHASIQETCRTDIKGLGNFVDIVDRDVLLRPLHCAQVSAVQASFSRQRFLRPSAFSAK